MSPVEITKEKKILNKKKGDPLALFGKFPDFPLNPKLLEKIYGREIRSYNRYGYLNKNLWR
jgi:hypothetical protein